MDKKYDYIICGGGLSGLQLALAMQEDTFFTYRKVLLIDIDFSIKSDKTWCFWHDSKWNHLAYHHWKRAGFKGQGYSKEFALDYRMIRSEDFIEHALNILQKDDRFSFCEDRIVNISEKNQQAVIQTEKHTFEADYCFDSLFDIKQYLQEDIPVLQHFVGWFIETEENIFDEGKATFMDFSIPQGQNTQFMYILPTSPKEALFEHTFFSEEILKEEEYENIIKKYLDDLGIQNYKIIKKEKGCIPMSIYPFEKTKEQYIFPIGTKGAWTKASTGFTFSTIERNTMRIIKALKNEKLDQLQLISKRHRLYDTLLLRILTHHNEVGAKIFTKLFQRNSPEVIFRFLDERSTIWEELQIILKSPPIPFLRAFFEK